MSDVGRDDATWNDEGGKDRCSSSTFFTKVNGVLSEFEKFHRFKGLLNGFFWSPIVEFLLGAATARLQPANH